MSARDAGTGATEFTYNVTDEDSGDPIAQVLVWVTTDNDAEGNLVASGYTDTWGDVVFYLDAGTYYLWRQKVGYDFENPDTETVT